jgi:hypothetical protein
MSPTVTGLPSCLVNKIRKISDGGQTWRKMSNYSIVSVLLQLLKALPERRDQVDVLLNFDISFLRSVYFCLTIISCLGSHTNNRLFDRCSQCMKLLRGSHCRLYSFRRYGKIEVTQSTFESDQWSKNYTLWLVTGSWFGLWHLRKWSRKILLLTLVSMSPILKATCIELPLAFS